MRIGVVEFGDQRLTFRYRKGRGTPIVFFHGTTGSAANWDETVARLDPTLDVICVNARGHGSSGRSPVGDYRVEAHVGDVLQLLERVVGPAVVVGHSLGGVVGFHAAGKRPDLVRGLYCEDIAPQFLATRERYEGAPLVGFLRQFSELGATKLANHHTADWLAGEIAKIGPPGMTFGELLGPTYLREWADSVAEMDPPVPTNQLLEPVSFDVAAAIAAITCPVHIARGEIPLGSLVTDEDIAGLSTGRFPVTSTQFRGVGHSIKMFAVHRFVDDLAPFLAPLV